MTLPLIPRTTTKYFACIGKRSGYSIDWTFEPIDEPADVGKYATEGTLVLLGREETIYALRHFNRTFYVGESPVVIHEGDYDALKPKL
jgi:hypothetical protein